MPKSWSEVQSLVIEKASRDQEYRRRLLEDPRRVVEEEAGAPMAEETKIKVIEAEPETGYVVLPPRLPIRGELSDAALESVAGGTLASYYTMNCEPQASAIILYTRDPSVCFVIKP